MSTPLCSVEPRQEETIARWMEELRQGDANTRWKAAKSLGRLGEGAASAVPGLIEALQDKSLLLRVGAAESLSRIGSPAQPALPALIEALKDRYASVREAAAEALGRIDPEAEAVIGPLVEALCDENKYVRSQAAGSLARSGAKALPVLLESLRHDQPCVRTGAAEALGLSAALTLPDAQGLIRLLEDDDESVRSAAAEAIANLERKAHSGASERVPETGADPAHLDITTANASAPPGAGPRSAPAPRKPPVREGPPSQSQAPRESAPPREIRPDPDLWRYPHVLNLGRLGHGSKFERIVRVYVPVECRLTSQVPGVSVVPEALTRGANEVVLKIETPSEDTPLRGRLWLASPSTKRWITIDGQVVATPQGQPSAPTRVLAWEPPEWAEVTETPEPTSSAPRPGHPAAAAPPPAEEPRAGGSGSIPGPSVREGTSRGSRDVDLRDEGLEPRSGHTAEEWVEADVPWERPGEGAHASRGTGSSLSLLPADWSNPTLRISLPHRPSAPAKRRPRWPAITVLLSLLAVPLGWALRDRYGSLPSPTPSTRSGSPTKPPRSVEPVAEASTAPAPVATTPKPETKQADIDSIANSVGMRMVLIRPGSFLMGSADSDEPNDRPPHLVKLTRPFYLGACEVTQREWREVMLDNPDPSWFSPESNGSGKKQMAGIDTNGHPVEIVSWLDAVLFCNRLSMKEGLAPYYRIEGQHVSVIDADLASYRLPTEAEWEYACRAGSKGPWYFGETSGDLGGHAWFSHNSAEQTHAVGKKAPNAFGLYDMYGDVAEWCWDWDAPYGTAPVEDPQGPPAGKYRALRGGAWNSYQFDISSSRRFALQPDERHKDTGFRVARNAPRSGRP